MTKELLKLKKDFWKNVRMNMTDFEGQDVIESFFYSLKKGSFSLSEFLEDFWFCLYDRWVYPFQNFAELHANYINADIEEIQSDEISNFFDELSNNSHDGGLNY